MPKTGFIVGKFCPPHKGHELLIKAAQAECDRLLILSYTKPEFAGYEPEKRLSWVSLIAPDAEIVVLDDTLAQYYGLGPIPSNDAEDESQRRFCAKACEHIFRAVPDVIFTSENYGDGFAKFMSDYFGKNILHRPVDIPRNSVPISGTQIRANVHKHREFLPQKIYADFVQSVCFLGAESTGKSTLSIALAKRLNTVFVEEYGRTLWVEKDGDLTFDDYLRIATTHIAMEDAAKHVANRYVFVDTTPLTTLFYAVKHFGKADERLSALSHRSYDHTFLCHPDFPLVQDGWRGDEDFRHAQHQWYVKELAERRIQYTDLTGTLNDKIETIINTLASAALKLSAS